MCPCLRETSNPFPKRVYSKFSIQLEAMAGLSNQRPHIR